MTTAQAIMLVGLGMVGVSLMAVAYTFNRAALAIAAAIIFLVAAAQAYTLSVAMWDLFYGAFWAGVLLAIIAILEGITLRPRDDQLTEEERAQDDTETDYVPETDYDRWREKTNRRRERRDSRRTPSHHNGNGKNDEFARTGRF